VNRRSFLGALAAVLAAPRLLAKVAPARRCESLIFYADIPHAKGIRFLRSVKLPPSGVIYGDVNAAHRRIHLRAMSIFARQPFPDFGEWDV
jgi:hypothetical protein